jgi:cytochrome c oxidase assembly protein subunit 11
MSQRTCASAMRDSATPAVKQATVANRRLGLRLLAPVVASLLFVAAQPFLYQVFCEWTGFNSIDRADTLARSALAGRPMRLEFDANSFGNGLQFSPEVATLRAKTGELLQVTYRVENTSSATVIGQAVVSYAPKAASEYIVKVACFCFTQQTFLPHEVRELPVVFMIDPKLPTEVSTVTLSYTFFEVPAGSVRAEVAKPEASL